MQPITNITILIPPLSYETSIHNTETKHAVVVEKEKEKEAVVVSQQLFPELKRMEPLK